MDSPDDSAIPPRRGALRLGAGLALLGTGATATAQNVPAGGAPAPGAAAQPPQDPRSAYARPPFPKQEQPRPGLTNKMTPRPDHGERSYRGAGKLLGRKALITGGDSGIGRAAAIAYAREGADVAIGYLPAEEEDAREVVQLIRAEGRKAVTLPGDIRSEAFCRQMVEEAVRQLGGLDILVNNAAFQQARDSLAEITTEDFDASFKTNVYAMFWITKAALPHLKPGAVIINTASINAYDPSPEISDYAATKAAITSFTKSWSRQLTPKGIRINAVAPGPYWTPLQPSCGQKMERLTNFGGDTPMGRPGQPAEIAPLYVLLADPASPFTSGDIFGSTGGKPQG
ncbi:SDR family oxidoreductase [Azohydromonas aeria]|uniref:SDR family oxidoreductase n=1 Tax=Azohydromonas aeria TaxID=2590212 RepID=UPI0012FAAC18|nr:SDR family oxidoreductase [Azohydromonas aeria]